MASILRQIVASPRARHPEAGLDLCYVTDHIVVTSGPSSVWPKKAYRNPLDQLVGFLDKKHADNWWIFEFRAEGTGYPDSEVYHRISHFPWPDHHPPPFAIIPNLMAAMRNWVQGDEDQADKRRRVAVVHCKAGKGRSGTATCSYLISEEGWKMQDALDRFTARRMRAGFGHGVSIPSQLRWVNYVDQWANRLGKRYVERPVEIVEIHVWGLRDGVKVSLEGYIEDGRRIRHFHVFSRAEKTVVDGGLEPAPPVAGVGKKNEELLSSPVEGTPQSSTVSLNNAATTQDVILRPSSPVRLPTSDVNIDFERRNKAPYTGFTLVTSIAHVWFNTYFEGGHEGHDSGLFQIEWEAMDGIKGSLRKGTKALDRMKVVWRYAHTSDDGSPLEKVITEPRKGEPVPENQAADWRGEKDDEARPADGVDSGRSGGTAVTVGTMIQQGMHTLGKELGFRKSEPDSANLSRASSLTSATPEPPGKSSAVRDAEDSDSNGEGVKPCGPEGEDSVSYDGAAGDGADAEQAAGAASEEIEDKQDTHLGRGVESGMAKVAHAVARVKPAEAGPDR